MLIMCSQLMHSLEELAEERIPPSVVCQQYRQAMTMVGDSINSQARELEEELEETVTLQEFTRAMLTTKITKEHAESLSWLLEEACTIVGATEPLPIVLRVG